MHSSFRLLGELESSSSSSSASASSPPRCALRGSLDPATGIFHKAPEHARIRTAQACDKCRARKAKCSGDHPVCERCRVRGLSCHYAPERRARRWSKARAEEQEEDAAVLDRSTGRSDTSQYARVRSTSSCNGDADCLTGEDGDGDGDGGSTAPRARSRCATIASTEVRSPDELARIQSDPSFSHQLLDLPRPRKGHGHPVSGSGIARRGLESTEGSMGTLAELELGTACFEENALALCFDPYSGEASALLDSALMPGDDVSDHPDGVPMLFHHPHRSGSLDLGTTPNDETPSLFCPSGDAESPGWTPSTSSSASPVLKRTSSDDLPTTPTNSDPSSPFALASLSPHLGPFVSDLNAYPLITDDMWAMDMGTDGQHYHYHHHHHHHHGGGMSTEYVGWREVKDGARSFREDLGLFVDMDAIF